MRNLISVVMPVYNAAPFLKEAVDSLLMQSFLDFELIVVEDASTDHSLEILDTYRDSRILVLKNEVNRGNYPSRNIGMSVAKGKYICVMDADDIALLHRLAVQFQFMETHPEILACGSAYQVIGSNEMYRSVQNYESIQEALLLDNCFLHPSLCFRTSVLKKIGMYNEDYIYASDYDFLCKMALVGPIVNLPDILMKYRWHNGQITQAHRLEQIKYVKRYYPDEIENVYSSVVYTVNQCAFRMGISCCYNEECIETLESLSRKYLFYFLKMKRASILSNCFSIMVYLNLPLLVRTLSVYSKLFMKIGKHS